ncbi:hypothetical protein AB1N83_009163 [Pleurotus pulmonarius]
MNQTSKLDLERHDDDHCAWDGAESPRSPVTSSTIPERGTPTSDQQGTLGATDEGEVCIRHLEPIVKFCVSDSWPPCSVDIQRSKVLQTFLFVSESLVLDHHSSSLWDAALAGHNLGGRFPSDSRENRSVWVIVKHHRYINSGAMWCRRAGFP